MSVTVTVDWSIGRQLHPLESLESTDVSLQDTCDLRTPIAGVSGSAARGVGSGMRSGSASLRLIGTTDVAVTCTVTAARVVVAGIAVVVEVMDVVVLRGVSDRSYLNGCRQRTSVRRQS